MADQAEENTDDSSIMPVSSLRSRFEQMGKSSSSTSNAPPRNPSPNRKISASHTVTTTAPSTKELSSPSLRPLGSDGFASFTASSADLPRQKPVPAAAGSAIQPPPAVTIEPPSSPPKNLTLNIGASDVSTFLAVDGQKTPSGSGSTSPGQFKVPSRPHTPLLDSKKAPKFSSSQPPEPPPPRRSAESRRSVELRRDSPARMTVGPPPPVNRAEKPRVPLKHVSLSQNTEDSLLPLTKGLPRTDQTALLTTPPGPSISSEPEQFVQPLAHSRSVGGKTVTKIQTPALPVDEPPTKDSKPRRIKQDFVRPDQIKPPLQASGDLPEQRPSLPARPAATGPSPRGSSDISRPSADTSRSATNGIIAPPLFSPTPKRIFSTPIPQPSTPPRHGRAMTVDQTGEKALVEFRTPNSISTSTNSTDPLSVNQKFASTATSASSVEFPDSSQANRRPPHLRQSFPEIANRSDTRVLDVCGDYVCTSGQYTRVWNLRNGSEVLSLSHMENVKTISVAFKAARDPDAEGSQLWLGNNVGELLEVDLAQQGSITAKINAHNRREVVKIYRHRGDMWTLDDGGTLNIWAPDATGTPNLGEPSTTRKVVKGHTFSMVVGHELWYASGKELRVYEPTLDERTTFQVLQRPLSQPEIGEITSGAFIGDQADRLYFGHNEGSISIYSRSTYSCLDIVRVSPYKINSLVGVGQYLWAAYSSGDIMIYDPTQKPWVVKKNWTAHSNPVIQLSADRSSFWKLDCQQVISLDADNVIRTWDGLLEEDWLEAEMQARDESFCRFQQIKTLVMTWNAGASTPDNLQKADQNSNFLRELFQTSDSPDIIVVGFQELVDLEDKTATAKRFFKSKTKDASEPEHMSHQYRDWKEHLCRSLDDYTPRNEMYHLLEPQPFLFGLFTCIFVKSHLRDRIRDLSTGDVRRGFHGLGNKGALMLRFKLDDTSICFVNCHLAAGQSQTNNRNEDILKILNSSVLPEEPDRAVRIDSYVRGGDGTRIVDHEICILNGDLNYRIDTMTRDAVVSAVKIGNFAKLLGRDQLLSSMRKNTMASLRSFQEMPITFAPTYKYDVGTDNYDSSEKKRAPAWCDRILSRGPNQINRLKQLDYSRIEVRVSDHRPVTAVFEMTVKSISPEKRRAAWEDCQRRFGEVRKKISKAAKLEFLTNVCGFDTKTSGKLLAQHEKMNS